MKTKAQFIVVTLFMILLCIMTGFANRTFAQNKSKATRIGVYDSRVVAFSWSCSDFFREYLAKFGEKSDSAQKVHDTALLKELSATAMSYQHLLHQTVFSNGSVGFIMKLVNEKLPDLAKTAGVSVILSKWELNYNDPSTEVVDLTSEVALLFQPKEDISKMEKEIRSQSPIPIDELSMEMEMIEGYCQRFGNK